MAYKSGNPALNNNTFSNLAVPYPSEAMSLDGVSAKALLLLAICVGTGAFGWRLAIQRPESVFPFVIGAVIIAFVIAIITVFKKKWAVVTAPIYAVLEGFALGAISQLYESQFGGIVVQALLLTAGIFASMLVIYRLRLIRATQNFRLGVAAATGGIVLYYLAFLGAGLLFGYELPLVASNSIYGIGFTVFVIIIAALNLVVDFDFIERGVEQKAPKYMEWYASFGLLVTLVWLYLEVLRLLAKLRSR